MPIKIKDHDKCKLWERRRRDRLNDAFKNLAQLLPHYDPAKIPAKIDILEKSTDFVKELRLSNSRLLSKQAETDEKCKLIKELQDEVNKLILRVKQLTILLKKASITIPTGPEIKSLGSKRHKWSGKLKPEDVENSVINNTNSISGEKTSAPEKVVNGPVTLQTSNNATSTPANSTSQPSDTIKTNSSATSTSVASIIIPLKETNVSKTNSCIKTNAKTHATTDLRSTTTTATVITSTPCQTTPTTSIITPILASPTIQTSPTKMITTSAPIFTTGTTNSLQLPLQTFIITPCPITGTPQATALPSQNPQIMTRIANILPAPILPRSLESISLQKIPIKSLLKPIPKVIKRRRRRGKNNVSPLEASTKENHDKVCDKVQRVTDDHAEKVNGQISKKTDTSTPHKLKNKTIDDKSPPPADVPEVHRNDIIVETLMEEDHAPQNTNENTHEESHSAAVDIPTSTSNELKTAGEEDAKTSETNGVIAISEPELKTTEKVGNTLGTDDSMCEPSPENIPVLRIIEASSESTTSTDILSTLADSVSNKIVDSLSKVDNSTESPCRTDGVIEQTNIIQINEAEVPPAEPIVCSTGNNAPIEHLDTQIEKTGKEPKIVEPKSVKHMDKPIEIEKTPLAVVPEKMDVTEQNLTPDPTVHKRGSSQYTAIPDSRQITGLAVEDISTPDVSKSVESCDNHTSGTVPPASKEIFLDSQSIPVVEEAISAPPPLDDVEPFANNANVQIEAVGPEPLVSLEQFSEPASSSEAPVLTSLDKEKEDSGKVTRSERKNTHKDIVDTSESVSTTDKISECIARSIDLIDANDSELMELGEHWEDPGTSPKSISPTQIFLNIFPLLPRESSASEHQQQQPTPIQQQIPSASTSQTLKNPLSFLPSSNSRSSFFIDAMLPDENSLSSTNPTVIGESNDPHTSSAATPHSPFLPLTPPQYSSNATSQQISSPFSLSNNYYWTPPTVSSSGNVEISSTEYRCNSSAYSLHESHRSISGIVSSSTSSGITTASSTFAPICTTKSFSTSVSAVTASSTSIPTPSVHTIVSTKPSNVEQRSSSKRSKSTAAVGSSESAKAPFQFDKNLSTSSKNKSIVTSTASKMTTPTTISVTWTLPVVATPTQTSTFPQHHSNSSISSNQTTSEILVHSTPTNSSSSSQVPHHSCSLLDSLNPMDAAFFRPLMNALESHDFRNLEFPGTNTLPPPHPPLPPLIPPPPTKPLYSSQPVQNSGSTTNFRDHVTPSIQGSFMHHHPHPHQPVPMFSSNLQQLTVESINPTPTKSGNNQHHGKHQDNIPNQQHHIANVSHIPQSTTSKTHTPASDSTKVSTGTDKTSRTSGRQKSEKKSRAGKSSRTQPYIIPNSDSSGLGASDSSNKSGQRYEQCDLSTPPQKPSSHNYSFHTIQSHINSTPSKSTSMHSNRSHGFHMENLHSSSQFDTSADIHFQKYSESGAANHSSHVERTQAPKAAEAKSQKSKEEKSQAYHSSSVTKQSKVSRGGGVGYSLPPPCLSETQNQTPNVIIPNNNNVPSSSQANGKSNTATGSNQAAATRSNTQAQHDHAKPMQNIQSSNNNNTFQMHYSSTVEPFPLFPDFTVGGNTRQFGTTHPHSHHYHHNDTSTQATLQQIQNPAPAANSYHTQRSHPYYFPDIVSSLENFPGMAGHQPLANHHVQNSTGKQSTSNSNNNYSQSHYQGPDSSHAKFSYGTNSSNLSQTQQPLPTQINQESFQQLHVQQQQQKTVRHPHHDPPHSCTQQTSVQQQTPTPATAASSQHSGSQRHQRPSYQQIASQSQSQGHISHSSTATTSTSTTVSSSSAKGKQQATPAVSFHAPTPSSSTHHHQTNNQHHQQVQLQHSNHRQHQNVPQSHPASRSTSSKTVNWMTDTGYRSTSSNSTSTANVKQQRDSNSNALASTSNPFSVSKLVGTSSASVPSKSQPTNNSVVDNVSNVRGQLQQPSQNTNPISITRTSKSTRNAGASTGNSLTTAGTNNQSQNQSNYCAEALIRKNPPPLSVDWANEFNLISSTNQGVPGTGYSVSHHHSNPHTLHNHHHTSATEHFSNYANMSAGSYHYPPGESHASSTNTSHFAHFDHSQPQYQATHHHQNQTHIQNMSSSNYSATSQDQRHHNPQSHSSHGPGQGGGNQIPYPHQHNYPHHSSHHQHNQSSTSSVTNFNLSTIFPEINDKRNNSGLGGQGGNSTTDTNRGSASGNLNPACGYHHPNFGNSTGGSGGNLH